MSCAAGAILDVVVDLRTGSPTFADWAAVQLDDENRRAVFLSEGLGHAFMALSDQATVLYLCSTPYSPGAGAQRGRPRPGHRHRVAHGGQADPVG